ncbi:FkbM family methyltransferase [Halalkalicoccus ordinarius]|uniref:FkbM family methyltransferase n=1 Tax=Halalkalicoccus ordinarius TaxID=3116651 RepID=UPI00300F2402
MGRDELLRAVIGGSSRAARRVLRLARHLPHDAYYGLSTRNYRHRGILTRKRVREGSFRSYELYDRHGNDWLLDALLDRCWDDDCVVDVGANTGVYALSVAAERPEASVVAIEPDPRTVDRLRANVEASGFDDRIELLPIGLGAEPTTLPFYRSNYHELSSFNRYNAERWEARVVGVEGISVETLDGLVADGEIPPPDHLKIDVEGFGREVLEGAHETLATHRPFVYVEPHATHEDERDRTGSAAVGIRAILEEHDYAIIPGEDAWVCVPETEADA